MIKHDVVIIGGSLAGAACARELQRMGIDAIALERDRFPRRKVCGGFLSAGGVDCLDQLGVLDDVRSAGAVDVKSAKVRVDSVEVEIPFERPGLGISRSALDEIVARGGHVRQSCSISQVKRTGNGFLIAGPGLQLTSSVVVDAAGKLSRFTRRNAVEEFGIQYTEAGSSRSTLDFAFFEDGYGGSVSIEGGYSNYCYLIKKDKLAGYLNRFDCIVTGPLAYDKVPGEFIAIGDAAGMVDPFCGEGMRHALDTGMLAARVVARGLRSGANYDEMRREYEFERRRRWSRKRAVGATIRRILAHQTMFSTALRLIPTWFLNHLWD